MVRGTRHRTRKRSSLEESRKWADVLFDDVRNCGLDFDHERLVIVSRNEDGWHEQFANENSAEAKALKRRRKKSDRLYESLAKRLRNGADPEGIRSVVDDARRQGGEIYLTIGKDDFAVSQHANELFLMPHTASYAYDYWTSPERAVAPYVMLGFWRVDP
jgi:hypothetical protein